jgi:hypothetical protein
MHITPIKRRITPFIAVWLGLTSPALLAGPHGPDVTGRWQFVDDLSGIEIAACAAPDEGLCARLVVLPKEAAALPDAQRRRLCGATIIGSLKAAKPKWRGELVRLEGWVIDPEDLLKSAKPERHNAAMVLLSGARAKLDVRGPMGLSLESHAMTRSVVPAAACE